jgi:hypothetical protein
MGARLEVGMSFTHANGGDPTRTEVRASMMKVLIGVDPHKVSVAAAVVDEGTGELLECTSFLQNLECLIHPSDPWPSPGHPKAMKMEPPPRLFSHQCLEGRCSWKAISRILHTPAPIGASGPITISWNIEVNTRC